jgi:hypothetical protein
MAEIVIAGVQKCATTALHAYLCRHPRIVGGYKKELHYFDDPARDWARDWGRDWTRLDRAAHDAQYPDWQPGLLRLDASPSYVYLPHCLERLRAFNPGVRVILLFRDPLERALSHWAMMTRLGLETEGFDAAIAAEAARLAAFAPGDPEARHVAYLDRGFYGRQLAAALRIFAPGQILCLASEALRADPGAVLARVSAHLGIAPFGPMDPVERQKAPGPPPPMAAATEAFLRAQLQEDIRVFSRLSGIDTTRWRVFRDGPPPGGPGPA